MGLFLCVLSFVPKLASGTNGLHPCFFSKWFRFFRNKWAFSFVFSLLCRNWLRSAWALHSREFEPDDPRLNGSIGAQNLTSHARALSHVFDNRSQLLSIVFLVDHFWLGVPFHFAVVPLRPRSVALAHVVRLRLPTSNLTRFRIS